MKSSFFKILLLGALLCPSVTLLAQTDPLQKKMPEEQLIATLNRSFFIPGEELQVAIESQCSAFQISRVAYLELVDYERKSVIQQKVALNKGEASATLYLPSYLKTGNYTLLVYTQWMKNWGDQAIVQRKISLVNPFIALPKGLLNNEKNTDSLQLKLFPEGGHFITGAEQHIGFRVINKNDEMVPVSIQIKDKSSKTIVDVISRSGYGYFDMVPEQGAIYSVVMVDTKDNIHFSRFDTYEAKKQVAAIKSNEFDFEVTALDPAQNQHLQVWHQARKIIDKVVNTTTYRFDKSKFPKGLLTFSIVDSKNSVLFSKTSFNAPEKIETRVELDKNQYQSKDTLKLSLRAEVTSQVTVTVRKKQPIGDADNPIASHYLGSLSREFSIDWPSEKLDESLLLLLSEDRLDSHKPSKLYLPDFRGELISGTLHDKEGTPIPNYHFYITLAGEAYNLYSTTTDDKGQFNVSIPAEHSGDQLIFSNIDGYTVDVDNHFLTNYEFVHQEKLVISDKNLEEWLIPKSQQVQIKNLYATEQNTRMETKGLFYNRPKVAYNLDDYTRFPTLADHIIEYIPQIVIKNIENGKSEFHIRNMSNRTGQYNRVLSTLNGIVISADEILKYDPLKIERIEIYSSEFQLGNDTFTGAISFLTYPDTQINEEQFDFTRIEHQLVDASNSDAEKFMSGPTTPDMCIQLGWEPHLPISSSPTTLTYLTSDIPGTYEVIISGVSTEGYLYKVLEFEVLPK